MSDDILTPAELAAHLRTSERTIARMVDDGCPSMLVRRRRRFKISDVLAWMSAQETKCRPEKTPMAVGTQRLASAAAAFTDAYRSAQLRVMPSGSKQS